MERLCDGIGDVCDMKRLGRFGLSGWLGRRWLSGVLGRPQLGSVFRAALDRETKAGTGRFPRRGPGGLYWVRSFPCWPSFGQLALM